VVDRNVNGKLLGSKGRYRRMGTKWMWGNFKFSFLHLMSLDLKICSMRLEGGRELDNNKSFDIHV
jgi:hypothetical protein